MRTRIQTHIKKMVKERSLDDENLDDVLRNTDLSEKTEMGDFADQIHKPRQSGSNITLDESSNIIICKVVFPVIGMRNNIADIFMEVAKSRQGWATEKVVQGAGGIQNQRSGGSIGGWLKDRMLTPK